MSEELLDLTTRENFADLRFPNWVDEEEKKRLKNDCQMIMTYAHKTVQDFCALGYRLLCLKKNGEWKNVIYHLASYQFTTYGVQGGNSFADFCYNVFGFSETRTSDLLRVAEFVSPKVMLGDNSDPMEEEYKGFKISQLIELASVEEEDRKYFTSKMTVADIRMIKDYMKNGLFCFEKNEPNFDVYQRAKQHSERKSAEKARLKEQNSKANEVSTKKEYITPAIDIKDSEEETSQEQIELKEEVFELIEPEAEDPTQEEAKYDLKTRDGVRAFLADYKNWECMPYMHGFQEAAYKYPLGAGRWLYALVYYVSAGEDCMTYVYNETVRYYMDIKLLEGWHSVEVTKVQIEKYFKKQQSI